MGTHLQYVRCQQLLKFRAHGRLVALAPLAVAELIAAAALALASRLHTRIKVSITYSSRLLTGLQLRMPDCTLLFSLIAQNMHTPT